MSSSCHRKFTVNSLKTSRHDLTSKLRIRFYGYGAYAWAYAWVDGFAFGVVRILIGFARIRSVCASVRIANQFAGEAVYSRAICTISRCTANPGRIRANPFSVRIVANCESTTQGKCTPPAGCRVWESLASFDDCFSDGLCFQIYVHNLRLCNFSPPACLVVRLVPVLVPCPVPWFTGGFGRIIIDVLNTMMMALHDVHCALALIPICKQTADLCDSLGYAKLRRRRLCLQGRCGIIWTP